MMQKSDNPADVGTHVFTKSGFGEAPFVFIDLETRKYQACPGAPVQPGGACQFCGESIMYVCIIRSACGKVSEVGTTCVLKCGDSGLIKAYKTSPQARKLASELRQKADEKVKLEWANIMQDEAKCEKLSSIQVENWRGLKQSWLTYAQVAWSHCGMAGRKRYLKAAKALISGKANGNYAG